jgi:hypothetical protein
LSRGKGVFHPGLELSWLASLSLVGEDKFVQKLELSMLFLVPIDSPTEKWIIKTTLWWLTLTPMCIYLEV